MSDEPVFVRSRWGTNRHVFNHRNPVGRALIVIVPVAALAALYLLWSGPEWSGAELREGVRTADRTLNGRVYAEHVDPSVGDLIQEAVENSGAGPDGGVDVSKQYGTGDSYQIGADGTGAEFCMRVEKNETARDGSQDAGHGRKYVLFTSFTEGSC
ncbi:hypothetical protein [Streptomyces sp. NPDC058872]|uniref:hypothetical protein n=1 Tax=Streptomyces sp. NPDC058872 TaxID=3346661 RepID=UPI0036D18919